MQQFVCPQCGHTSTYDPWIESAHCSACGYTPQEGTRARNQQPRRPVGSHQHYLNQLTAHWQGNHEPDPAFNLPTIELALHFFREYQRALGEDPHLTPGVHGNFIRSYHPAEQEILSFVGAYLLLRRGKVERAARQLRELNLLCPRFSDPWIWRSATVDDPQKRRDCLENALLHEPAHPLARDAMAILRGALDGAAPQRSQADSTPRTVTLQCRNCGGTLRQEVRAGGIVCPHCGHVTPLEEINVLDQEAVPVGDLQLRRRYQRYRWQEVDRVVHCQTCAAELTMSARLAERCPFCGSTNVLLEDNRAPFEQPDGVLAFQVDEAEAAAAVEAHLQSRWRRLKRWWTGKESRPGPITDLYLPFWVFDGFVQVRTWESTLGQGRTPPSGSTPVADTLMFDNLVFPAYRAPDPDLVGRVLPYELEKMAPYEPTVLANRPAALYQLDVELVAEKAGEAMIELARRESPPLIPPTAQQGSASRPRAFRRSFQVSGKTYQLILLPLWVQIVHQGEQSHLAVVNGQTGKAALGRAAAPEESV